MTSAKRKPTTPKTDDTGKLAVVASNIEEEKKSTNVGGDTVTVACHLPFGLKFDDVPDGDGTKTIIFPGINEHARGAEAGILLGVGKSVATGRLLFVCTAKKEPLILIMVILHA